MPTLNTSTSIVDYLKSKGMDSSFASRSKLATDYGIANYTGTKDQNTQLLSLVQAPPKTPTPAPASTAPDYSKVNTVADANKAINSSQVSDMASASKADEPPIKTSYATVDAMLSQILGNNQPANNNNNVSNVTDIFNAVKPTIEKPAVVDLTQTYTGLRDQYGINSLETQMTDLNTELNALKTAKQTRINAERGKPVATNVIAGRVSEVERQENERIASIENSIKTVNDQLTTKYKVVENLMNLTSKDYEYAVNDYDKKMTTNISLFNTLRGINEDAKSDAERAIDNARSSLQIVYNSITSNGTDIANLPASTKSLLTKLEVQAGLPSGFYEALKAKSPKADIVATYNWTGSDNKEMVSVLTKDPTTGEIKTSNMVLGNAKVTTKSTDVPPIADQKKMLQDTLTSGLAPNGQKIGNPRGKDGYVDPQVYIKAFDEWTGTLKDFLNYFPVEKNINPASYSLLPQALKPVSKRSI